MMDLEVIKFGGSSLADNHKLKQAVLKTISFLEHNKKVVVVVSAQGKTTDDLLKQAKELSKNPNKRELDMLVSVGEQISCSKFAICLQEMGVAACSLTGWQAGIVTDEDYTQAKIHSIYTGRIWEELKANQVVVISGFQGINRKQDITTLGRDGSDTTAIAIAAALEQKECYIFTDIDGVYDKDPHKYKDAKKIEKLSYAEMKELARNGAKVLHDRCINIAEKYHVKIIVASTLGNNNGSIIE